MTPTMVSEILRQALMTAFWASLPLLALCLIAGLVMSLIQILTSLQDTTFATVPKLAVFVFGAILLLPWMMTKLVSYTSALLADFSRYAR